jgi:hypothetical protein
VLSDLTLGTTLVTAQPYFAWSKPIESWFRAFRDGWENLTPGWTGIDAKDKPEALALQIKRGRLLTWAQFEQRFAEEAGRWNSTHVCGERTAPPNALYMDARARAKHLSPDTLSFLLQRSQTARVKPRGIEFLGRLWWGEELALHVGANVTVRGLPGLDHAFAYTAGDRVIALRPALRASWDTADGEANKVARRGRKLQRAYLRSLAQADAQVPIEVLDPSGDFRQAAANAAALAEPKGGPAADTCSGPNPASCVAQPPSAVDRLLSPHESAAAASSAEASAKAEAPRRMIYDPDPDEEEFIRRLAE